MKLTKVKEEKQFKYKKRFHNKNASEDLNILPNSKNFFLSKLINPSNNSNKIKANNTINEDLPNLKSNIQSIFANDDKKQRAIQYLIKIRKVRNSSPSTDFRKILSDISSDNIIKNKENTKQKEITITPYNNNKYKLQQLDNKQIITSFDMSQKILDKRPNHKNTSIKDEFNYTIINNKQKLFNYNSPFSINDKNIKNKFDNKSNSNKTFDKLKSNENNPINNYNNYINLSQRNNYAFGNYIKNYNLSKIKNKILSLQNIEKNYEIQEKSNHYNTSKNNKNDNRSFYIHKKPIYTKINLKNNLPDRNVINSNVIIKEIGNNKKRKFIASEIKKNDYKIKINTINKANNDKASNIIKNKKNLYIYFDTNVKKYNNNLLSKKNSIQLKIIKCKKKQKEYVIENHIEFNIKRINNKIAFNNEGEIIRYIKSKYKNEKIRELFFEKNDEFIDYNIYNKEKEKLENEINKLRYDNKQYKKELFDIRNQYNDLFKEINILKEENEKLKENFINNMINDDNNEEYNEEK